MLLALLFSPLALAGSVAPGEVINPGVSVDITKEGFDAVAGLIPALLPSSVPVGEIGDGYAGAFDQCWLGGYEYKISNANVSIEVLSASITPGSGELLVDAALLVSLNDPADPFQLYTSLECIDDTCNGYVNPFPVNISTGLRLSVVDDGSGNKSLDATMGEIVVDYELDGADDIMLEDCTIGTIEEVLNFVGISLYDLILGLVGGTLESSIADLGPELESTIEEAFSAATIEQDLELNGAMVHLLLQPSNVDITPASARIWLEGSFSGEPAACIAAYDPGGSLRTDSSLPDPDDVPSGVSTDYHAGALVGDDFANSALYALWRGGLLCIDLDAESSPIPLDTSILNLLTGDAFAPLFPESEAVTITTRPVMPPTVAYTTEHDLGLTLDDLNLDLFAELDGRSTRMISIGLDGTAGADLNLDGATGELGIEVDLDPANFTPTVTYNEIEPSANATVEEKFAGLFQTILDSVVGGLLEDLNFALPSFSGLGLTKLEVAAAGEQEDWLGVYAQLGPVSYEGSGCGGCGGTDTGSGSSSSDCGGCDTAHAAPWAFIGGVLTLAARRRRNG